MSEDISGKAFKNVSGSSLQITDVGIFEIRPDGMVSTADYPILETSTQFRRLVSLSYLLEDPSRGRLMSDDRSVRMQTSNNKLSDDDMIRLADEVASRIEKMINHPGRTEVEPSVEKRDNLVRIGRGDEDRAEIINHVIKTSLPMVQQFGDLDDTTGETVPDVDEMVQRIQNMGGNMKG